MKKYITAVLASAAVALGSLTVAAQSDTTTPVDQSGRAVDRSQVPSSTTVNNNVQGSTQTSPDQSGRAIDRSQVPSADTTGTATPATPSTTQNLPDPQLPGRALDRAALPNPAGGYATDEPAGANTSAMINSTASNPAKFLPKAYEADQSEIRTSQLAQEKSSNDQVKALAQMIIQDHQAHAAKVQQLAQQKNIQVSDQLSSDCQKKIDKLSALNGPSFDRHYVHDMVRDHRDAIQLYSAAAQNNTDPDVKALAQNTLPTLREHLQMAERGATTVNEPAGAAMNK
jgi:putative membrane protein